VNWTWDLDNDILKYGQEIYHTYTTPGEYTVKLIIEDNQGAKKNHAETLLITVAEFNYLPLSPVEIESIINFIDNSSDKYGAIINWTWNFNDDTISYGKKVNHTYLSPGNYSITLTIRNDKGDLYTYTQRLIVDKKGNGTPGFESILLIISLSISLIILSKKKHRP